MGACDTYVTLKGKTREAMEKDFWNKVKDAKHEYGHGGYTGSAAEFCSLRFTSHVFNSIEEMQEFVANLNDKDVAHVVQVKVVEDTATIKKWIAENNEIVKKLWAIAPSEENQRKQLNKQREMNIAKIKAARLRKAAKSKKTVTFACGWVSE